MTRNIHEELRTKMFTVNLHITTKIRLKLNTHMKKYISSRLKAGFASNLDMPTCLICDLWGVC